MQTKRYPKAILVAIGLLLVMYKGASAHPHVFIVQRLEIVFDHQGLAGFKVCWSFDDMFSAMIGDDYDRNKNGALEPAEVASIKEGAFSNLAEYSYFIFVRIDGNPFEVKYVKNFSARLSKGKLVYEFLVPCHVRAIRNSKHIVVAIYDPSYYTSIEFAQKNPVGLRNAESFEVKSEVKEDKSTAIYYGMIHPWALFLDFRLKQ